MSRRSALVNSNNPPSRCIRLRRIRLKRSPKGSCMVRNYSALPPLPAIEKALHKTTEHLVHEVAARHNAPERRQSPPRWDDLEWRIAEAAAAMHGIAALLSK